jgi:hypothetical protein
MTNDKEEAKRVLTKIDSCLNLMQNGKFIFAYEKLCGIRQIVLNIAISCVDNNEVDLKENKDVQNSNR